MEEYPAGCRKVRSKILNEDIWVVNLRHTAQARGYACIGKKDFVLTESELKILQNMPDEAKKAFARIKKVFVDCDLVDAKIPMTLEHQEFADKIKKIHSGEQTELCLK